MIGSDITTARQARKKAWEAFRLANTIGDTFLAELYKREARDAHKRIMAIIRCR